MSVFGTITFFGQDKGSYGGRLDRLAIDEAGHLLLASVLADRRVIRGMSAALNNHGSTMSIAANGVEVGTRAAGDAARKPPDLSRVPEAKYEARTAHLPYGMAHAIFVARSPGFMPAITEAHLWRDITSPRFTTPILREWMPWVTGQLLKRELLVEARCYRCECGILRAGTIDLDAIVADGVRGGHLPMAGFKSGDVEILPDPAILPFPSRGVA